MFWETASRTRNIGRHPEYSRVWGEGLVDLPLSLLWYGADWDNVSDDELVFLIPALTGSAKSADAALGAAGYLTRILKARALSAARLVSSLSSSVGKQSVADALKLLTSTGILTQIPVCEISKDAASYPVEPSLIGEPKSAGAWSDPIVHELTAVARLDRMLCDALANLGCQRESPRPMLDWPLSFADIVVSTIHARLNGAYVYPGHAFAHELLTIAAVIGHLAQGRPVFVFPALAQRLVEILSAKDTGTPNSAEAALRSYVDRAYGCRQLRALAERAVASYPRLAKPRRLDIDCYARQMACDARLAKRIRREKLLFPARAA